MSIWANGEVKPLYCGFYIDFSHYVADEQRNNSITLLID